MTLPKPTPEMIAGSVASLIGRPGVVEVSGATITVYANNGAEPDEPFEPFIYTATFQEASK